VFAASGARGETRRAARAHRWVRADPSRVSACRERHPTTYNISAENVVAGMDAKNVRPHVEGTIAVCERFVSIVQHMV